MAVLGFVWGCFFVVNMKGCYYLALNVFSLPLTIVIECRNHFDIRHSIHSCSSFSSNLSPFQSESELHPMNLSFANFENLKIWKIIITVLFVVLDFNSETRNEFWFCFSIASYWQYFQNKGASWFWGGLCRERSNRPVRKGMYVCIHAWHDMVHLCFFYTIIYLWLMCVICGVICLMWWNGANRARGTHTKRVFDSMMEKIDFDWIDFSSKLNDLCLYTFMWKWFEPWIWM